MKGLVASVIRDLTEVVIAWKSKWWKNSWRTQLNKTLEEDRAERTKLQEQEGKPFLSWVVDALWELVQLLGQSREVEQILGILEGLWILDSDWSNLFRVY